MQIINKTGRVIAIYINEQWETYMPEGDAAILNEEIKSLGVHDGITLQGQSIHGILNLPDRQKNVLIVVDKEVALYSWRQCREDVVYMHKPLLRDDKYNSLASFSLMTWNDILVRYCL